MMPIQVDSHVPAPNRVRIPEVVIQTIAGLKPGESVLLKDYKPISLRVRLNKNGIRFTGRKENGAYRIWKI